MVGEVGGVPSGLLSLWGWGVGGGGESRWTVAVYCLYVIFNRYLKIR